ncbi:hypothetical protein Tco_0198120 [Tanacetum coccineum]
MGPLSNPSVEAYEKRVQELTDEGNRKRAGSEEFDWEMLKVQDVVIEQGRKLGRREAQGFFFLSMAGDGGLVDLDPSMIEKIALAVAGP